MNSQERHKALMLSTVLLWVCSEAVGLSLAREHTGAIEGFVLDLDGNPIGSAAVSALEQDRPFVGVLPGAVTDRQGHFLINGLQPGDYIISAAKERDNYPETTDYFYGPDRPPPKVTVYEGEVTRAADMRLGPKGGRLVGKVVDAQSRRAIPNALFIFYRADSAEEYAERAVGAQGKFNLLVPTDKQFRVKVTAPDYQPWYCGTDGTQEHAKPMRLTPDTTKELVIALRPLKK